MTETANKVSMADNAEISLTACRSRLSQLLRERADESGRLADFPSKDCFTKTNVVVEAGTTKTDHRKRGNNKDDIAAGINLTAGKGAGKK